MKGRWGGGGRGAYIGKVGHAEKEDLKTHPSFLKASSVWNVFPMPFGPQMPSTSGTRTFLSKQPNSHLEGIEEGEKEGSS